MYRTKKSGMQILISIIVAILAAALLGGAIFGVVKLVEYNKSETQKPSLSWEVGALDVNGEYRADKGSIYTKAPFGCQGLNVELDFDATVSYQIYFYDTDSAFLSSTGTLNKNFKEKDVPFAAAKARIVVTPKDDESISWTEKNGYAKQLTITVLKEQTHDVVLVTSKENILFDVGDDNYYLALTGDGSYTLEHGVETIITYKRAVDGYSKVKFMYGDNGAFETNVYFLSSDNKMYQTQISADMCFEGMEVEIPETASFVLVAWDTDAGNLTAYLV